MGLAALDATAPIHLHIAEQVKEVEDCVAWCGRRPVEWLLENRAPMPPGAWCTRPPLAKPGPRRWRPAARSPASARRRGPVGRAAGRVQVGPVGVIRGGRGSLKNKNKRRMKQL